MSDEFPQVKEVVRGILPSDEAQHDGSEHHADCSSEQQPVTTADITACKFSVTISQCKVPIKLSFLPFVVQCHLH